MAVKKYDVVGICNALVDILVETGEDTLQNFNLTKGVMHLVSSDEQAKLLNFFKDQPRTIELGGSTLNALRSLAGLGAKTSMAGMVGDDQYGEMILNRMMELEIDPHLGRSHEHTGTCLVLISPDGERTMNTCLGASRLYDETHVPHAQIRQAKVLHFCGYQWDTDQQKTAIYEAIQTAKEHRTLISFDVADPFVVERNREEFLQIIAEHADIVFSNEKETELLFKSSPEDAAARIAEANAIAVIKLGAKGALIQKGTEVTRIAPEKTNVVDTTAAGDMFAAGFLYGFTSNTDMARAGKIAATLAACVISRVGTSVHQDTLERAKRI